MMPSLRASRYSVICSVAIGDGLRSGREAAKLATRDRACSPDFQVGRVNGSNRFSRRLVRADRHIGLLGSYPGQADMQLVADKTQHVQKLSAEVGSARQRVVEFVNHQNPHPVLPHQLHGDLFSIVCLSAGAWPRRCAERDQYRGPEPWR